MSMVRFAVSVGLVVLTSTAWSQEVAFEKKVLCDEAYYCDGVATGDFDRDGAVDIVAGPFWYSGPEFEQRQEIFPPAPFNPAKGQSDSLFSNAYDFNGDGWDDVLVRGRVHLHPARWYENPQGEKRHWKRHVAFPKIQGENPPFADVTGDGRPEIVTHWERFWGYVAPNWNRPQDPWTFHPLGAEGDWPQFHHGQGVGDITGDGLTDIVINQGWLARDKSQAAESKSVWSFQEHRFSKERGGAQMLVYDVDGDGDNDVITSLDSHGWGLAWFENTRDEKTGKLSFVQHTFMGSREEESKYGVAFSQPHALVTGDIDGDGLTDVVVGKRRWAHGPKGDIEPNAPAVVYWFRLERTENGVRFRPHLIDDNSGVGLQIAATDVNADGHLDVLTASKLGTFLFLAKPQRSN
ncbi:MAG: VCBS repeat-containing protein [Planctomycetes bacterium]|nr:VCBS repeat-containing protein [Planctomycetota bacterium]MBL7040579.1 VCBS repeat-containing protein [Pirellulaceae bacterium]